MQTTHIETDVAPRGPCAIADALVRIEEYMEREDYPFDARIVRAAIDALRETADELAALRSRNAELEAVSMQALQKVCRQMSDEVQELRDALWELSDYRHTSSCSEGGKGYSPYIKRDEPPCGCYLERIDAAYGRLRRGDV